MLRSLTIRLKGALGFVAKGWDYRWRNWRTDAAGGTVVRPAAPKERREARRVARSEVVVKPLVDTRVPWRRRTAKSDLECCCGCGGLAGRAGEAILWHPQKREALNVLCGERMGIYQGTLE